MAAGIALVTEDRQRTGLALRLPIAVNVTLANVGAHQPCGFLDSLRENANGGAAEYIERLRIRPRRPRSSRDG